MTRIGQKLLDRYELLDEAGRGGMGVVYRGRDPVLEREVAIKMIPPMELNPETKERFQREARLVAGMDHPAIVPIHDFGSHEGSLFFVMPWVRGTLLSQLIQDGALVLDEILAIAVQVAEGLDYSHSRGVVHRDVKPGNIMVTREGNALRARVLDFGLARGSTEPRLTKTGGLVGSMTNLSPEQIATGKMDPRSDIYALGTVLYECLTGEPPFSGAVHSVLYRIVHDSPRRLRDRGFADDPQLEEIVLACLRKDPAQRPQSGAELAEMLARHRAEIDEGLRTRALETGDRVPTLHSTQPLPSPMVGRRSEWAELQARLSAALGGECQFVLVEGEAGTGKSRLLLELENLARTRGLRVLRGRFVDREAAIPYQGLCDLVQDFFRLRDSDRSSHEARPPSAARGAPARPSSADFSDLSADLVSLFPLLAEIRELRDEAEEPDLEDTLTGVGEADPTRLYELLARTLARIGGGGPLVLLIESLHMGDVSLAALSYIVRRLGPTPTLVVGTCRRTEVDAGHPLLRMLKSFSDDPRFVVIALGALGRDDFRRLLEIQLGSAKVRDDLLDRLYDATEGNPYFGQELVRSLLETGGLSRDESGVWALLGGAAILTEALPETIQQAVERRIERLPDPLRQLLSLAAVLGRSFTYRDVLNLAGIDGELAVDLDDGLDELVRQGLLEEDVKSRDDRLHFTSGMVRDLLYHDLSRRKRRSLHRRHAHALEKRYAGRLDRVYPQLVHHFSEGDVAERTLEYASLLARKSLAAFSPDDAIRAARTALEFLEDEDEAHAEGALAQGELLEILAAAYRAAGSTTKALREAERSAAAYQRANDLGRAARAALLAAETAWQARQVASARTWVDRGIELAQDPQSPKLLRRLLTLGATVANLRGEAQAARRYLEQAERLAPAELDSGTEEPVPEGGTLYTALPRAITTIDPVALKTLEELEVAANVFETLLAADEEGNLIPSLCERWETSADGLTFELVLRGDVFFSDGWPLSARDVRTSFARSEGREDLFETPGFDAIESLEVAEPGEEEGELLRFHLKQPLPIFAALLSDVKTAIVREVVSDGGAMHLLGTGPFRVFEATTERVVLERNPNYWRGTPPALDRIELLTSLSSSEIAEKLKSGELDVAQSLQPVDLESILRDPRFRSGVVEATQKNVYFLLLHPGGRTTRFPTVRQALADVVRPQDLVWRSLGRFAQPAVCLIPPGVLGHDPGRRHDSTSRGAAARAIAEAGVERPICLQAVIHPLFQDSYRALLDALFDEWATLGVEVADHTPDMESYLRFWTDHPATDVDLVIGRWNADFGDPDSFTHGLFHSRIGRLKHVYSSPEGDEILERARQEAHSGRRQALYQRFEELLRKDRILVPLFHDVDYRIAAPQVRRLRLFSAPPFVNYDRLGKLEESAAPEPAQGLSDGGELHVALPVRPQTLDLAQDNIGDFLEVKVNVFEPLTRISEEARVVPWLAAFFETPGGGSYQFRLREKVRFHDGRRLTSRDVRYTFERLLRLPHCELHFLLLPIRGAGALRAGEASALAGFQILSADQFVIELDEPLAFFPTLLTHPGLGIVPEGAEAFTGSWRDGCVGTGPFRVVRFDPGDGADLEKNPDYWRPDYPKANRLVFHFGVDPERTLRDFREGRLSLAGNLSPEDAEALRRDPEFARGYLEAPRLSTTFLALNCLAGPFADAELRRSLAAALDVEGLVRETMGNALFAHSVIPPGLPGYEPPRAQVPTPETTSRIGRDVELSIGLHPSYSGAYSRFWEETRSALTGMGFTVRVLDKPLTEVFRRGGEAGGVDLVLGRWIADYPDADTFLLGLVHSQEGLMARLADFPEIDALIERGRYETDRATRHATYREAEERVARESYLIPLFHEQTYRFRHPSVRGVKLGFAVPEVRYEELYVVR